MSLDLLLLGVDAGDLHLGVMLTMPLATPVTGLVLVPKDVDLRTGRGTQNFGVDRDTGKRIRAGGDGFTVDEQDGRKGDGRADLAIDPVDVNDVTDGHLLLVTAGANDRVHHRRTLSRRRTHVARSGHVQAGAQECDADCTEGQYYGTDALPVKPASGCPTPRGEHPSPRNRNDDRRPRALAGNVLLQPYPADVRCPSSPRSPTRWRNQDEHRR